LGAALAAMASWAAAPAAAQPPVSYAPSIPTTGPAGYYLVPSLALAEVFDSNVFLNTNPQFDFITRLTPGVEFGYKSAPLTILGNYSFDTEVYARNPDLDNVGQNQRGVLDIRYLPERRTTLGLTAVFARSSNPVLLAQQQGLQPIAQIQTGRQETTGFTIAPSASYKFSRLWSGAATYSYSLFTQQGGTSTTSNVVTLGTSRVLTPRDTGSLSYYFRTYESDQGSSTSNALTLGWKRALSPFTTVTVRAGPRLTQGQLGPEVFIAAQQRMKFIDLSASYTVTEGVDLGQSAPVTTHTLAGAANFRVSRFLEVSVGPSFQTSSGTGQSNIGTTHYYAVNATATYQINKWLSARASYSWSLQTGSGGDIPHNLLAIGLAVVYPMRID
jgi:hypothetical protein